MENKKRNINLDLIRCVAVFGVVCVHFFINTGFYDEIVIGKRMALSSAMRTFFMYCVPLFILLTGYLMNSKKISRSYYKGILHTIGIYIISSMFCIIYKSIVLNGGISFLYCIKEILNFSGAPYSWYIEMYIGLFLLIPFLNIVYWNLRTKQEKHALLLSMFVVIVLPTVGNIFGIKLIPEWWKHIWPFFYYFVGCYIREYSIRIPTLLNVFFIVGIWIFNSIFNILKSYNSVFEWGAYNDWYGWENVTLSIALFLFLVNLKIDKIPECMKYCIMKISKISLGIYLCSWIADDYVYYKISIVAAGKSIGLEWFPVAVGAVFVISAIFSLLGELIYEVFVNICRKIKDRKLVEDIY